MNDEIKKASSQDLEAFMNSYSIHPENLGKEVAGAAARAVMTEQKMQNLPKPSGRAKTFALNGLFVNQATVMQKFVRRAQKAAAHQVFKDEAQYFHDTFCVSLEGRLELFERLKKTPKKCGISCSKDCRLVHVPIVYCPYCSKPSGIQLNDKSPNSI